MSSLVDHFVQRSTDQAARRWVAAALMRAFPDPGSEQELTHARAALAPFAGQLAADAERIQGRALATLGRTGTEPLLALAVVAVRTNFGGTTGQAGRMQLFRLLVELVCADAQFAKSRDVANIARALRLEFEAVASDPATAALMPVFKSSLEAIDWFGRQDNRFAEDALSSWKRKVGPALRAALLSPVPPPGHAWEADDPESDDGLEAELPARGEERPADEGETAQAPVRYWLLPDREPLPAAGRRAIPEEVIIFSVSTAIPLSRFATASTTFLFDAEVASEMRRCLREVDESAERNDLARAERLLTRAIATATATPEASVPALRWESVDTGAPRPFPGTLSVDARWLFRQPLRPGSDAITPGDGLVAIPIPPSLARRITKVCEPTTPGKSVFEVTVEGAEREPRTPTGGVPGATLRRALLSRLVRDAKYGATLAQHVAADDLGINIAPLFYDQIETSEVAVRVAQLTFRWFGDDPRLLGKTLPQGLIGSQRVPPLGAVRKLMQSIHGDFRAVAGDRVMELRHRMRNCAHGLALVAGHRPNDNFSRLRVWSFSSEDPVGVLADKVTAADWQVRPVAVPPQWAADFAALLAALAQFRSEAPGSELGRAAGQALEGSGPVFLDIRGLDDVQPFGAEAYRDGCPEELLSIDNFARQLLNNRLTRTLREPLRVAQLGWHGTRDGAWAEGSPWSVLSAARQIVPAVQTVLKDAGWRPLPARKDGDVASVPVIDWVRAQAVHDRLFRERSASAKQAEAERDRQTVENLAPRFAEILSTYGLGLGPHGELAHLNPTRSGPVEFSTRDQDRVLRYVSGADARSREARAARNHLHDLVEDARRREVLVGPLPRRVVSQWPVEPGPFLAEAAVALDHARALDALIARDDISMRVRTALALVLHGGYADSGLVLRVMQAGTRLGRLSSLPNVLLVKLAVAHGTLESADADGVDGCVAFHGIAALHLLSWHRTTAGERSEDLTEAALDVELRDFALRFPDDALSQWLSRRGMAGVAALARACNAVRMDGWARPVGTGRVRLTTLPMDRIAAIRDSHLVGARRWRADSISKNWAVTGSNNAEHRAHSLVDQLTAALAQAVKSVDHDNRREAKARSGLTRNIRGWLDRAEAPRPEELIALFVLSLLERGGRRKEHLQLRTIQGYMQAVARPICRHFPERPLDADPDDWEAAYLAILAAEPAEHRSARLDGLLNFHWVLSQELQLPEVAFSTAFAFVGTSCDEADAGGVSDAELSAFLAVLRQELELPSCTDPARIHELEARDLAARLVSNGALRPGEVNRLLFGNLQQVDGEWYAAIRKTMIQRLKTPNSRRRVGLTRRDEQCGQAIERAAEDARERLRGDFNGATRAFHHLHDPGKRLRDDELFDGLGALLRWVTGRPEARLYWLRKAEVRRRLEQLMGSAPVSLWPMRDFLASIGHGSLWVALGSYTHDPVTPFARWFTESWFEPSADRIAIASGLSLSTVRRRRGDRSLSSRASDVTARTAALLQRVDVIEPDYSGTTELPWIMSDAAVQTRSLAGLSRVLESVARGRTAAGAIGAHRWPMAAVAPLEEALTRLEVDFGLKLGSDGGAEGVLAIPPPRGVAQGAAFDALMDDLEARPVMRDIAAAWLAGMQHACIDGILGTPTQWEAWKAKLPVLSTMAWQESKHGRTMVLHCPEAKPRKVSAWPMLRWSLLVVWCHDQPGIGHR